jgi:hypothetical protein
MDDHTRRMRLLTMTIEEELISQNAADGLGLHEDQVDRVSEGIATQIAIRFELQWTGRPSDSS